MSSLEIRERFEVVARPERVFAFLADPHQVVVCLPGAELTGVESPTIFLGAMKVKVGPVAVKYKGRVELTEVDEAGRRMTMIGQGKEGASDSARLTMQCAVVDQGAGRSEVSVDAQVEIAGKLVRFGRGMIQTVSEQLFKVFVQEMKARLEGAGDGAGAEAETVAVAVAEAETGAEAVAVAETGAEAETETGAEAVAETGAEAETEAVAETQAEAGTETAPTPAPRHLPVPAPAAQPINVLPLLFKSMWEGIKRFFKRLFGGGQTPR